MEQLVWHKDRIILGDLVFRLEHHKSNDWDLGDNCFIFYKTKPMTDLYLKFWSQRSDFKPQNILELGMWDGGSVAFWFEYFQPHKHVGVDIQPKQDNRYFKQYIASRGLAENIKTYWATDQADAEKLREIVKTEFSSPLDLVIDDASHMYDLTKKSFEILFPLLRPGGLYVIEDWPWEHWKDFQAPDHPWANKISLTQLISELVEATGSSPTLIAGLTVSAGFVVVERGQLEAAKLADFKLENFISRRPEISNPATNAVTAPSANLNQLVTDQKAQLQSLTQKIEAMEQTKAWRLASKWYAFKSRLGGPKNVPPTNDQPAPPPASLDSPKVPSGPEAQFNLKVAQLNKILNQASATQTPKDLFGQVSDDFWLWLYTEGYRHSEKLRQILPGMPDEAIQKRYTGKAGDEALRDAFSAYTLFKQIAQKHLASPPNTVLDFGCSWGRIIRFFLKDIEPSQLWGVDCGPEIIKICRQTNKWCNFEVNEIFPPITFADNTFDLIYCFSVFSHLSEEAHQQWVLEFSRILKPGGLLIATTRPREFILLCDEARKAANPAPWQKVLSESFVDTAQALADYDQGKLLHEPLLVEGKVINSSFYGETCIPKAYVLNHWPKSFEFVDYIDDRKLCSQNIIVVRK